MVLTQATSYRRMQGALYLAIVLLGACEAGAVRGIDTGPATITLGQNATDATDGNEVAVASSAAGNSNGSQPNASNANSLVPTGASKKGPGIAIYWGTGNSQGKDPNFATVCATPQYDIIIISFANKIGSHTRNADGYPEMSISGCGSAINSANPYLPDCSAVGALIPTCQAAGKKVILSLGGGDASVGFNSNAEGTAYATMLWNLLLGGDGNVRPFGAAILDGIDLDIESGSTLGYGAFVTALRALMDADTRKPYLITAAPQCVFPDAWMGPDDPKKPATANPNTPLSFAPTAFDHLFVQFYNNDCRWANADYFATTYKQWSTLPTTRQPKIWIGLVPTTDAAMTEDYVAPAQLTTLVQAGAAFPSYGGVMLWDAGYDLIDAPVGQAPYSQSVALAQNSLVVAP